MNLWAGRRCICALVIDELSPLTCSSSPLAAAGCRRLERLSLCSCRLSPCYLSRGRLPTLSSLTQSSLKLSSLRWLSSPLVIPHTAVSRLLVSPATAVSPRHPSQVLAAGCGPEPQVDTVWPWCAAAAAARPPTDLTTLRFDRCCRHSLI
jgi:hypothetical protein